MSRARRDLLLLFLALVCCGLLVLSWTHVQAIDEVVDNYTDTSRVNTTYQVVRNATFDVMELNFTTAPPAVCPPMDIWTTGGFTEVDPGGNHLKNINGTSIWFDDVDRDEGDRIFKDFGANYFDTDFEYRFRVYFDSARTSNPRADFMVFAEENVSMYITRTVNFKNYISSFMRYANVGAEWALSLRMYNGSAIILQEITEAGGLNVDQWYHVTMTRVGDNVTVWYYHDALKTNLDFMLTVENENVDNLRYFHPLNAEQQASGGRAMDLKLNFVCNVTDGTAGYELTGYFTTTNFMAGLSYDITVGLFNTSIPGGSINVEWSPDWLAWTDLGLLPTNTWSEDLRGFASQDGIFRFNFTRGGPRVTPRLYQVRLVHEGPGAGPGVNVSGSWVEYNFTSIIALIGTNSSVGGNFINQTYWLDGYQYNVTEVVGAPGYDIRFNITGLPDGLIALSLRNFLGYDGSGGHTFQVEAYNHSSGSWVFVVDIPDTSEKWINGSCSMSTDDFIQGGEFWGRYYHPSPGNVNHLFYLDYGKLRAFAPTPCPTPTPAEFSYLQALAIILLLIGLMIGSRVRR